jgi:hypothetical protein
VPTVSSQREGRRSVGSNGPGHHRDSRGRGPGLGRTMRREHVGKVRATSSGWSKRPRLARAIRPSAPEAKGLAHQAVVVVLEPSSALREGPVGTPRDRPVRRDLGASRTTPLPNTGARPGVYCRRRRVCRPRASALTPGGRRTAEPWRPRTGRGTSDRPGSSGGSGTHRRWRD